MMEPSWKSRRFFEVLALLTLLLAVVFLLSGESAARAQNAEAKKPLYPRVTTSICYEVDPAWPRRPKDTAWGQMPGVAVDKADHVWLFTRAEPPVQVYRSDGEFVRSFSGRQIAGDHAKTMMAHFLRIDPRGMIWLADTGNHCIWHMTPDGKRLMVLGTPGKSGDDATHFNAPTDVAVAPDGDIFVADGYGNARVVHFDKNGRFVKAWGRLGVAPGEFSIVHSIVLNSAGRLYVADRNNARVQVFDRQGTPLAQWRNLMIPWGLWISPHDELWVCGCSPTRWSEDATYLGVPPKDQMLMRFDTSGRAVQLWMLPLGATGAEKPGELNWLHAVAADSRGDLYLADIMGRRAQKFVRRP